MGKLATLLLGAIAGAAAGALLEDPIRRAWNASGAELLGKLGINARVHDDSDKKGTGPDGKES